MQARQNTLNPAFWWVPPVVAGLLIFSVIGKMNFFAYVPFITGISLHVDTCLQVLLLAFEAALAVTLVIQDRNADVIRVAFALFVVYTAYLCVTYLVLRRTTCGCGAGEQFFSSRTAKFVYSVVRNLAVLLLLRLYYGRSLRRNRRLT